MTLVKIAETPEIPRGQMKVFKLAEKEILIVNVNGNYYPSQIQKTRVQACQKV